MRIAVAAGSDPPDFTIDNLAGFSQGEINPGQRLAVDPNSGAVYTLFQQCPITVANCNNIAADPKTIHWFLNRSTDGGHAWTLNGSSTGIQVATGQSTQPQPKFGTVNAFLGGVNHVAVDPNNSDVYVVFGNRDPKTANNRLSMVRLTSNGKGGLKIGKLHLSPARCKLRCLPWPLRRTAREPSGSSTSSITDSTKKPDFRPTPQTWRSAITTASHSPPIHRRSCLSTAKDDGDQRQRVLGDYEQLKAVATTFYGVQMACGDDLLRSSDGPAAHPWECKTRC